MTVVVPVYNPGVYFERTLRSLLRQTLSRDRYEIMLVDDGSTDGTAQRLDRAAVEHPDVVRVTHIPNSGWPGRPRNVGTDLATYDYVFYCDADDWLPEDALEHLLTRAEAEDSDLIVSRVIGNRRGVPAAIWERGDFCTNWRETPGVFSNMTTQKLFSREFLKRSGLRFSEGKVRLEDFIFMTQAYLQAERISILGSRPCYVLELRDDRGNLTSTAAEEDAYFASVERIIDIVDAHTSPGTERDLALDRVVRAELIGSATSAGWLRKTEPVRAQVLERAAQLLRDRVPPTAVARLDARTRQRADAILRGDRALIERWIEWDAAVSADLQLTAATWESGKLRLELLLAFHRDGEVMRLHRSGDRFFVRPPAPADGATAGDEGFDVTDEVKRTAVHLMLRSRDISEEWRVRAKVSLQSGAEGADEIALRWSATATVDFSTISAGRPLRAGVWDLYVRLASCGMSRDRRVGAARADGVDEPAAAVLDGLAVSPFFTKPGNLSFDVDQWSRSLAAEVARRGAGPARVNGRSMTAPLSLVVEGRPPEVEVHLLPSRRSGAAPLVQPGVVVATDAGRAELAATLPGLPRGRRWSVRLRFGGPGSGPTSPVDLTVTIPGPARLLARRLVGPRVTERMARLSDQVTRRRQAARRARSGLQIGRTRALRLARVLGVRISGIRPGAALLTRSGDYEIDALVPGEAYVVSRKSEGNPKLVRLTPKVAGGDDGARTADRHDPVFLASGQTLTKGVDVAKVGAGGWLVSRRDPSSQAELDLETGTAQHLATRHVVWMLRRYRIDRVVVAEADNGRYADLLRSQGYAGDVVARPSDSPGSGDVSAQPRVLLKIDASGEALDTLAALGDGVVGLHLRLALAAGAPGLTGALAGYEAAGFELSGVYPTGRDADGRVTELECTMVRAAPAPR